jgi:hypothetical protein
MSETIQAAWSDAARAAAAASKKAKSSGLAADHKAAADLHGFAADHHAEISISSTSDARSESHMEKAEHHTKMAEFHDAQASAAKATSTAPNDVVRAAGTSEGAKKGWEDRVGQMAHLGFGAKGGAGFIGKVTKVEGDSIHIKNDEGRTFKGPSKYASFHSDDADERAQADENRHPNKASDTTNTEVIHCRSHSASGPVLAADKPWSPGEQVEFMWMPSGVSTICAGFRKGSIELTVNCDENTAAAVQASLESWRAERPKQEPFGCIEHKEQEASFRVGASCGFKWNDDGVYLAAEPTTLGAQNVNGRVHRSWSPSFTTDADYSKATEHNGVLMFPEGVRGSRSNPAQITGVDFCVGTLTNKPAFHSMSPVKASDAVQAQGNSEGAKKGWEGRKGVGPIDADAASEHLKEASRYYSGDYGEKAHLQSAKAFTSGKASDHKLAAKFHQVMAGNAYSPAHGAASREVSKHHIEMSKHEDAAQATDTSSADSIKADCAHTLKQDVPDATPAEVACYEKCLENGGSHTIAVEEIRKQRNPAAKASEPTTPDTILARQASVLERANAIATEHGVARTTLDDVYEKVTAGTSEGVKKSWETRKYHSHPGLNSDIVKIIKDHASQMKEERQPGGDYHKVSFGDHVNDGSYSHSQSIADHLHDAAEKHGVDLDSDDHHYEIMGDIHGGLEKAVKDKNPIKASGLASIYSKCAVTATGTSESVKATWSDAARQAAAASKKAHSASNTAGGDGSEENHYQAKSAHADATLAHSAASAKAKKAGDLTAANLHADKSSEHLSFMRGHAEKHLQLWKARNGVKATDATPQDILNKIYARAGETA